MKKIILVLMMICCSNVNAFSNRSFAPIHGFDESPEEYKQKNDEWQRNEDQYKNNEQMNSRMDDLERKQRGY